MIFWSTRWAPKAHNCSPQEPKKHRARDRKQPGAPRRHPGTPRRHPGAPRRHPGNSQKPARRDPGLTQSHQGIQARFWIKICQTHCVLLSKVAQATVSRRRERRDPHRSCSLRTGMNGHRARTERHQRQGPSDTTP